MSEVSGYHRISVKVCSCIPGLLDNGAYREASCRVCRGVGARLRANSKASAVSQARDAKCRQTQKRCRPLLSIVDRDAPLGGGLSVGTVELISLNCSQG